MLLSKIVRRNCPATRRTVSKATQAKVLRVLIQKRKKGSGFIWHRQKSAKEIEEHDPWKMDMREFEKEFRQFENGIYKDYVSQEDLLAADPIWQYRQAVGVKLGKMDDAERMLRGFWYENSQSFTEDELREMETIFDQGEAAILSAVGIPMVTGPTTKMPEAVLKELWSKVKKGEAWPSTEEGQSAAVNEMTVMAATTSESPEVVSVGEFAQFCALYPDYQMKPNDTVSEASVSDRVQLCQSVLNATAPAPADMAGPDGVSLDWIESVLIKHGPKELVHALTRKNDNERVSARQMFGIPWFPMWESTVVPNMRGEGIRDDEQNQVAWDQDDPMGPRHHRDESYYGQIPYEARKPGASLVQDYQNKMEW